MTVELSLILAILSYLSGFISNEILRQKKEEKDKTPFKEDMK